MQSIAQFFNHAFGTGNFELYDKNKNRGYSENVDGYWKKESMIKMVM